MGILAPVTPADILILSFSSGPDDDLKQGFAFANQKPATAKPTKMKMCTLAMILAISVS